MRSHTCIAFKKGNCMKKKSAKQAVGILLAECQKRAARANEWGSQHGESRMRLTVIAPDKLLLSTWDKYGDTRYRRCQQRISFPAAALPGLVAALQAAQDSPILLAMLGGKPKPSQSHVSHD